jgi:hypothetical protein
VRADPDACVLSDKTPMRSRRPLHGSSSPQCSLHGKALTWQRSPDRRAKAVLTRGFGGRTIVRINICLIMLAQRLRV